MLTDKSDNFAETWKFLRRRLDDSVKGGELIDQVDLHSGQLTDVDILGDATWTDSIDRTTEPIHRTTRCSTGGAKSNRSVQS